MTPDERARKIIADCALAIIGDVWREESDVPTLIQRMRENANLAEAELSDESTTKKQQRRTTPAGDCAGRKVPKARRVERAAANAPRKKAGSRTANAANRAGVAK